MTRIFRASSGAAFAAAALAAAALAACGGPADQAESPPPTPVGSENTEQVQRAEPETSELPESAEDARTVGEDSELARNATEAAASPFENLPAPYNTADYARGERTYKLCVSCHLIEEGAGHRVGPNLHGLFDRKVGEAEGFAYSDALLEADFQWTPEELEEWLANPRTYLPGNRMSFSGVRRPEDRTAVIAYLLAESAK